MMRNNKITLVTTIRNVLLKQMAFTLMCVLLASFSWAQSPEEAWKLIEMEQTDKGLTILNNIVKSKPGDSRAHFNLGYAYLKLENPDTAHIHFDKSISLNAKDAAGKAGKGYAFLLQGKEAEGQQAIMDAVNMSKSKDALVLNTAAEGIIKSTVKKNPDLAIKYLNTSASLNNKNPETFILLGDAYLQKNDGGKAVSNYESAAAANNKYAKAYHRLGQTYMKSQNREVALTNLQQGVAADPNYTPIYRDLGELYYKQNKIEEAKTAYRKYLDLSDIQTKGRARYASFLYISKDYQKAIDELNILLKTDPENPVLHRILGYSLYETGDYANGLKAMEQYFQYYGKADTTKVKMIPSDYMYYGKLLMASGNDSLGVEQMYKSAEMETDTAQVVETYQSIAETFVKEKKYEKALPAYEKLATIKPKLTLQDQFNMGLAAYFNKSFVKADSAFSQLTAASPDKPEGYLWLGRSRAGLDPETEKGLAKPSYEKFIEIVEADPTKYDPTKYKKMLVEGYSYLGYYNVVKNDEATANKNYRKVLELDPADKNAKIYFDNQKANKAAADKAAKAGTKGTKSTKTTKGT